MSVTTAFALLKLVLELGTFLARRAERLDIEKALKNELLNLQNKRVDDARNAHDDVMSGRVSVDPDTDPNRRD